jgi:hypothetical protein
MASGLYLSNLPAKPQTGFSISTLHFDSGKPGTAQHYIQHSLEQLAGQTEHTN